VPGLWNVNEKRPPGATVPESHEALFDVDVCGIESVLVHVIVVPAATSATSGLKALVVNPAAPTGIETDDDCPDDVGEGEGGVGPGVGEVVDEYPPLHATANMRGSETANKRKDDMRVLLKW
jgi:hypothetical protein